VRWIVGETGRWCPVVMLASALCVEVILLSDNSATVLVPKISETIFLLLYMVGRSSHGSMVKAVDSDWLTQILLPM